MFRFFYIICLCLLFNCQSNFLDNNSSKPKIIVSVVVDQMRYDYLTRLSNKFSDEELEIVFSQKPEEIIKDTEFASKFCEKKI